MYFPIGQTGHPFCDSRTLTLHLYPARVLQGRTQAKGGQKHLATGHKVHNPFGAITFSILHSLDPHDLAQLGVSQAIALGQLGRARGIEVELPHLMLGHGMHPNEPENGITVLTVQDFVPQRDAQVSQARIDGHGAS